MTKVKGGKAVYGASIGILMLQARFPRILGDMGNALTWPFPVHYKVVRNASPDRVVRHNAEGLYQAFLRAAQELIEDGADGITTNCGFLSLYQEQLSADLSVPVMTSSLMQLHWIDAMLPHGRKTGILTIDRASLSERHLQAAGVAPGTPIQGTEGGREFTRAILGNQLSMDVELARQDNIDAALALQSQYPEVGAILLECTNMIPYAQDISRATGLPVFSIYNLVLWMQAGLAPRCFL